jgi:hypothetical protein
MLYITSVSKRFRSGNYGVRDVTLFAKGGVLGLLGRNGDKGASPGLDFADWFGKTTPSVTTAYAAIALAFLTVAQLFHLWELRRKW